MKSGWGAPEAPKKLGSLFHDVSSGSKSTGVSIV